MAQGYTALWKQVSQAQSKDLPKTEIEALDKIVTKAQTERAYGQLIKALLMRSSRQTQVSPDSVDVEIAKIKSELSKSEAEGNRALAAVYQSVLGRIYRDKVNDSGYGLSDEGYNLAEYKRISEDYYAKSMEPVELLAKQSAKGYEPALVYGIDSQIFGSDLLHVLGMESADYKTLHDWYLSRGNRQAACICALYSLRSSRSSENSRSSGVQDDSSMRKSRYLQALDSLISEYQDLKECGELAIERYQFMEQSEDATAEEKMNYINYGLQHWGSWPRMNILRNAQNQLTLPSFSVSVGEQIQLPNTPRRVDVRQLVNCQRLTMTVQRVNVDGDTSLNPNNDQDYQKLKRLVVGDGTQQSVTRLYVGQPDYKVIEDSMTIEGLPVGVYLVEFSTERTTMRTERALLYVSDLYVVHESLPGNKVRLAVLNATTGRPVAGAHIRLTTDIYGRDRQSETVVLTTDSKGEAEYKYMQRQPERIFVYTEKDKACPETYFSGRFTYYNNNTKQHTYTLMTDRRIYRPGQTAHVGVIAYETVNREETHVKAGEELTLVLRNANHEVVSEKKVTTDDYGTAWADFQLPQSGLTGQFSVSTKNSSAWFSVEEYKRPTFKVEFDEVTEMYQDGDTVTVTGRVKSFADVPVQGAQVSYSVTRRQALWWWRSTGEGTKQIAQGTLVTDDEGCFHVPVVMQLPEDANATSSHGAKLTPRFYSFSIAVDATDAAGESHHGETSLPLSNKATAFAVNLPEQTESDSVRTITFNYLNNAGKPIPATVTYFVDDAKKPKTTAANAPFKMSFSHLKSGQHELVATCGTDTLRQKFVVFSMKDKHPATETHDWFYQSAEEFPRDGSPVYIQMGASDKDQHIVYTLFAAEKVLESGTIDQSNAVNTRLFTYKEEYGDGLLLTCAWVRGGQLYSHRAEIRKPLPDKRLSLTWKTFRDRLTPGQQEEWVLHVDGARSSGLQESSSSDDTLFSFNAPQLMAVLFDHSLDDIRRHSWSFGPSLYRNLPSTRWYGRNGIGHIWAFGEQPYKSLTESALDFTHFDDRMFEFSPRVVFNYSTRGGIRVRGTAKTMAVPAMPMAKSASKEVLMVSAEQQNPGGMIGALDVKGNDDSTEEASETLQNGTGQSETMQVRENLNETAFFYPALLADENGDVKITFTLPESITTWRFIGLAHDKDVRFGILESEAVAKKDIMIQPNMPRFLRLGDSGTIAARIHNTAEKSVKGTARLELLDPETEKVVYSQSQPFSTEAGKTANVSFSVEATEEKYSTLPLLVCRITAQGNGFSDGEQHYLPILPDKELVTNTMPFTQNGPGTKTIDLAKLFEGVKASGRQGVKPNVLTVEYTNNPAWLMIQTLPTVAQPNQNNAISLTAAVYANSIASHLLHQSPDIKKTIEQWQMDQGTEGSLMSSLEKNQELKSLVLDETPWVADARHEADQKQQLISFFDENTVRFRLNDNIQKLRRLQNADGSWSWWPGMLGSKYMTVAVSKMLVRLNAMLTGSSSQGVGESAGQNNGSADSEISSMLAKAYGYMSREMVKEVEEMKKEERKGAKNLRPSETAIDWLYLTTLDGRKLSADAASAKTYLVNRLAKQAKEFTIYGKAYSAVILGKNGYEQKAKEYLQSISEYSVYTEEMGRYFDTRKAAYSWFDYKIPTEVAAIEAFRLLQPQDTKTVEEMQRWLLQEKRTQSWDTPINTVDAVYAFLSGSLKVKNSGSQGAKESSSQAAKTILSPLYSPTILKVDGRELATSKATAGLGYVKSTQSGTDFKTFTAEKTSTGTSWGAVYAQFLQPVAAVSGSQSGLKITREVFVRRGQGGKETSSQDNAPLSLIPNPSSLKVGDRVQIRITIEAERDYDFVQVVDKRAACLEPVGQLSGYRGGYYCAPRDNTTSYYFDRMAKGRHVVETEYYVDRAGTYQTGTCTAQCAYSPEYTARTAAKTFLVEQ